MQCTRYSVNYFRNDNNFSLFTYIFRLDKHMTAKAYWIANSTIHDMDGLNRYRDKNRAVMTRYGAKFIVMHGQQDMVEGKHLENWTVVEFPSYEAAKACYRDPQYIEAAKIRHAAADGIQSIVEGYDGPQDF
jgi:uncharacterized protein (DUF1330 family)